MKKSIYFEIEKGLKFLPPDKVKEVRDFVNFLLEQTKKIPNFKKFFNCIKKEEAELMERSIERACERINYEEW